MAFDTEPHPSRYLPQLASQSPPNHRERGGGAKAYDCCLCIFLLCLIRVLGLLLVEIVCLKMFLCTFQMLFVTMIWVLRPWP